MNSASAELLYRIIPPEKRQKYCPQFPNGIDGEQELFSASFDLNCTIEPDEI